MKINSRWLWVISILFFIAEYFLFRFYVLTNIAPYYPSNYDQTSLLPAAYQLALCIRQEGIVRGLQHVLSLPAGPLFLWQAGLFMAIAPVTRLSALTLNFLYFILLQTVMMGTAWRITRQARFVFLLAGCLLLAAVSYQATGGLYDFRMDFIAFCLYGTTIMVLLSSAVFLHRASTVWAAFFAVLLMLIRILSVIYWVGMSVVLWLYFLYRRGRGDNSVQLNKRMKNLLLWDVLLMIVMTPVLWFYRAPLFGYYIVGHVTSSEGKIRAITNGVVSVLSDTLFYPKNLINIQLGRGLSVIVLILLLSVAVVGIRKGFSIVKEKKLEGLLLIVSIAIPFIALTSDQAKSAVVLGIIVIPLLFLLCRLYLLTVGEYYHRFFSVTAYIIFLAGILFFIYKNTTIDSQRIQDMHTINRLYTAIGNTAVTHHLNPIFLSVDQYRDYLANGALATWYFEQHHQLLTIGIRRMGSSIFPITKQEALDSMQHSDFIILQIQGVASSLYPYDHSMETLRPLLIRYAAQHFHVLGTFGPIEGKVFRVYANQL